jgi:peptidoglycan-associated lipoprotein
MKSRIAKSLTIAALAAALAACSSVPLDDKAGQGGGAGQGSSASGQILDPFNPQSILAHQQQTIKIEGNTDERGGAEYNLALGQRRADAVRRMMTLLGVSDNQIETISFGKEKPKATGTSEADFAENRRADIVYRR